MPIKDIQELITTKALKKLEADTSSKFQPLLNILSGDTVRVEVGVQYIHNAPPELREAFKNLKINSLDIAISASTFLNNARSKYLAANKDKAIETASREFLEQVESIQEQLNELIGD
jgi:hypothetical protein